MASESAVTPSHVFTKMKNGTKSCFDTLAICLRVLGWTVFAFSSS